MSLIVLNSRGQDPAEFENHGFNLRLGKETQICLCGVNLNRPPQTPLQMAVGDSTNNGWIIVNSGRLQNDLKLHSLNYFRIKEGVYDIPGMTAEMTCAMNGDYLPEHRDNFGGLNVSCWRKTTANPLLGGLEFSSPGLPGAEQYALKCAMTKVINGMKTRLTSVYGAAGGAKYTTILPLTEAGNIPNGVPGVGDIVENGTDGDYIDVKPSNRCKNFICADPLWNTSNDATLADFAGAGVIPADGTNDGWTWGWETPVGGGPNIIGKIKGGVISSKWVGGVAATRDGENIGSVNEQGPQAMASRWGIAGTRFDIYWTIGPRTTAAAYQIEFYSSDMDKNGNYKNNPSTDTKWGELQIPTGAGRWWEICMRPVSVNGAPAPYLIEAWARQRGAPGGPQVGAAVPATQGGATGHYVVNETTNALYKNLPIFQGVAFLEQEPLVGPISFRSIHHNTRPNNGFGPAPSLVAFSSAAAALNNAQDITCCFTPTSVNFQSNPAGGGPPSTNPLRFDVINQSNRRTGIGPAIGFQTGTIQQLTQGTTAGTGVVAFATSRDFESGEPVAIIQLTNIPLHGELGGGSTIWGGSNGGQVLGVAEMDQNGSYGAFNLGMNVYSEPTQTNWIDVGNMASDSLNQIRVKITDPTGRKIVGLFPDTTIWIKTRNREHANTRTGGVDMRGNENPQNW